MCTYSYLLTGEAGARTLVRPLVARREIDRRKDFLRTIRNKKSKVNDAFRIVSSSLSK